MPNLSQCKTETPSGGFRNETNPPEGATNTLSGWFSHGKPSEGNEVKEPSGGLRIHAPLEVQGISLAGCNSIIY